MTLIPIVVVILATVPKSLKKLEELELEKESNVSITICFKTFFVWAFKIVVDTWKVSMLLLYILWDDSPILMISGSNEQLQQQ